MPEPVTFQFSVLTIEQHDIIHMFLPTGLEPKIQSAILNAINSFDDSKGELLE